MPPSRFIVAVLLAKLKTPEPFVINTWLADPSALGKVNPVSTTFPVPATDSVKSAFASVGKIDGVVYLVGDYTPMHAQDWNEQEVIKMADTNFMGALRVLGTCVPGFVERDEGHSVIIGSLAGFTGLQGSIGYGASKAALMHLAENLSADFYQSKIRVQLFNPGFVDTKLTLKNKFYMPFKMSTERAAAIIANGMLTNKSVINFPWLFSLIFRIGRILPIKYSIFGRKNNI